MNKKWLLGAVCAFLFTVITVSVNAALVSRLGGLAYYDDVANLTWLADANAAGITMNWTDANIWAAGLDVAGVTGWRLADSDTCTLFNCTSSEMGNLFYNVLGGVAGSKITTIHNANYYLFSNVQSDFYWTATEHVPDTVTAWFFNMSEGSQHSVLKDELYYAWAVQSGDIGAVPVPAAFWLFGSGLLGLIGTTRKAKWKAKWDRHALRV